MTREEAIELLKSEKNRFSHKFQPYDIEEREKWQGAYDMAIKALEQESMLDEIRAEIERYQADCNLSCSDDANCRTCDRITFDTIYRIIDKYREGQTDADSD